MKDIWIQTLLYTKNPKERGTSVMTNVFSSGEAVEYRMGSPKFNSTLTFVESLFPRVGRNTHYVYKQNGSCYQLKAGNYLLHICYTLPEERKYMVRVIGQGVTLKLLE